MPDLHLTKCEMEVMEVVWAKQAVTVQDVVDGLGRELAYTTVMTTLNILEQKRGVVTKRKAGRAYVYEPCVTQQEVQTCLTGELSRTLFNGSIKSLVLSLFDSQELTAADIQELKAAIESLEAKQ